MLCEDCHQREVMVKITQVIGSDKKTINLCKDCAEKQGLNHPLFDISKVFGKIIVAILSEYIKSKTSVTITPSDGKTCSKCGLAWTDFKKTGRLGCPQCYEEYEKNLKTILRRIHGNNFHIGKSVNTAERQKETLPKLKKQLEQAIAEEEYENAAQLRDRIREIMHKRGTSSS
jgi:protein arginine kinase activator